jgi:hypothetical protein
MVSRSSHLWICRSQMRFSFEGCRLWAAQLARIFVRFWDEWTDDKVRAAAEQQRSSTDLVQVFQNGLARLGSLTVVDGAT